jgi:preprotein translocase subunit SecF
MKTFTLVPDNTKIDFIGRRFIAFASSGLLIIGAIVTISMQGLNFGIDFAGGTLIEMRLEEVPRLGELRSSLNKLGLGDIQLQEFGQPDDLLIRMPQQEGGLEVQQKAIEKVKTSVIERYGEENVDFRRTEFVGPQVGEELKQQGLFAILFSLAGILAYIWFRFEWQFGIAAVSALAHDSIITIGLFSLMQWQFDLSTVAAVLMIAGYSINDTVVVFDRVRENLRKYKKTPLPELFNLSINQMLNRSLMTSITTILALAALWFLGGEVIRGFVNALVIGIVIGTYSSIFVATPILLYTNLRDEPGKKTDEQASKAKA